MDVPLWKLPEEFVKSYGLSFDFDADYRTTHRFLESCRQSDAPKSLRGQVQRSPRHGRSKPIVYGTRRGISAKK